MIIAVTGANGHVGTNLCQTLTRQGHTVRALAHHHTNALEGLPVILIPGDVLDKKTLQPLLSGAEVVFHLAARISITGDKEGMVKKINLEGTSNMLEVTRSHRVSRFIHFSSIHAISQHPLQQPLDERRELVGTDGYSYDRSKADAERLVLRAAALDLDTVVLSPTAIIGPSDPEPSLIGQAVLDLCHRRIPSLVPGGYDWVDVRDVVDGAIAAMTHGRRGEKYLLSGAWRSLKEFSALISRQTGIKTMQTVVPMGLAKFGLPFIMLHSRLTGRTPLYTRESLVAIGEGNRSISNAKARAELGYNPRPLEETMMDLINWFRENGMLNQ